MPVVGRSADAAMMDCESGHNRTSKDCLQCPAHLERCNQFAHGDGGRAGYRGHVEFATSLHVAAEEEDFVIT